MIVRLHNLSARAPVLADISDVAALIHHNDSFSGEDRQNSLDSIYQTLYKRWQAPQFQLATDAWVIVTNKGEIVGYAEVRPHESARNVDRKELAAKVCIHTDFLERGIETLLIWLVEERARLLSQTCELNQPVALLMIVDAAHSNARRTLAREGYSHARRFWRVSIDMDNVPTSSYQEGLLHIDLMLDRDDLLELNDQSSRSYLHVARQYDVYEKVLQLVDASPIEPISEALYARV